MGKLITLDKDNNIKLADHIEEYIAPDFIYVPIKTLNLNIKLGQYFNKEEKINNETYLAVSGKLKGLKECVLSNGLKSKCLIIENDFEEKNKQLISSRKNIDTLSKKEFVQMIQNPVIKEKFLKNFSLIVVSGIDDEIYVENESFVQKNYTKEILELLEAIQSIFNVKINIAVKSTTTEVINSYENYFGIYDDIALKLVDDLYLIGQEQFLIPNLNINEDYIYLTTTDIYNLWINIKKNHKITEKLITLSGNALDNPQVILTKLGTSLAWIINNVCNFKEEYDLYINGLMQGKKINDYKNLIVDENLSSIIFMKKQESKAKECFNCGACLEICPINSNPVNAYKYNKKINCINCGLCSYICPAYINLRKYIMRDEDE